MHYVSVVRVLPVGKGRQLQPASDHVHQGFALPEVGGCLGLVFEVFGLVQAFDGGEHASYWCLRRESALRHVNGAPMTERHSTVGGRLLAQAESYALERGCVGVAA